MSAAKPILYSYFRSSASWRVRIALAHKGIDYEYKAVNIYKGGDQFTDAYRELNAMKQVPTLLIDGMTLTQSIPIIEYLDETRPANPLVPKDPIKRYQARQIAEMINSGIQPLQNLAVVRLVALMTNDEGKKSDWAKHWIALGFQGVEQVLSKTSGKFCVGDEMSLADVCLVPQVYNAGRFGVDLSPYPHIQRISSLCKKLEVFRAADYRNQPDTPHGYK